MPFASTLPLHVSERRLGGYETETSASLTTVSETEVPASAFSFEMPATGPIPFLELSGVITLGASSTGRVRVYDETSTMVMNSALMSVSEMRYQKRYLTDLAAGTHTFTVRLVLTTGASITLFGGSTIPWGVQVLL